jgi:hypothetical protein
MGASWCCLKATERDRRLWCYDSMFAYAGTFTAFADKVVHHIDMSWNQAWTGTDQIRFLRLQGDSLTYVGAPARNPMNGRDCVHCLSAIIIGAALLQVLSDCLRGQAFFHGR